MAESVSGPDLTALKETEKAARDLVVIWIVAGDAELDTELPAAATAEALQAVDAYRAAVEARVRAEVEVDRG